jgi:hypothetical protein
LGARRTIRASNQIFLPLCIAYALAKDALIVVMLWYRLKQKQAQ